MGIVSKLYLLVDISIIFLKIMLMVIVEYFDLLTPYN
jgi:hypothetical protein